MLPYLIAGAIGFGIGKLFENGGETFMTGGQVKEEWKSYLKESRVDALVKAGYSKNVAKNLSSESWDSLEKQVQNAFKNVLISEEVESMKSMMESLYTYGGLDKDNRYLEKYKISLGNKLFNKTFDEYRKELEEGYDVDYGTYTDSEGWTYNSLRKTPIAFVYREIDDPNVLPERFTPEEVIEFIGNFNQDFDTNYKDWQEFNKGEEYRKFEPIMLFERKFENGGETFMAGGRITTNEGIIESFLNSNREVRVGNLESVEMDDIMYLRNYRTFIAKRMGDKVKISSQKYSKTTSTITNRLKALAEKMGYSVEYVTEKEIYNFDEFVGGGEIKLKIKNVDSFDKHYDELGFTKKELSLPKQDSNKVWFTTTNDNSIAEQLISDGFVEKYANGGETFMAGGRITTNEDVLNSFLTSTKEVKVNNLSTHFNEYDDFLLLRNYYTLIATRKGNDVKITNVKHSKTTSAITNRLKALAEEMGYNVSYVSKFENGGILAVRNYDADYFVNESGDLDDNGTIKKYAIEIQSVPSGDVIEYTSAYSEKEASEMIKKINTTQKLYAGGGETFMAGGNTGDVKVKSIKKKAEKLLEESISYRWINTDMGSGWSFELESPSNRSVFNVIERHTYLDEFSPEDAGIEWWDDLSDEDKEYYYEEWKEELWQGAYQSFKEKCMKHLDDFIEYLQRDSDEDFYAGGGEAGEKNILRRGTPIRKNIRKKRPKTRNPKMVRTIFEEEYFKDFDNGGEVELETWRENGVSENEKMDFNKLTRSEVKDILKELGYNVTEYNFSKFHKKEHFDYIKEKDVFYRNDVNDNYAGGGLPKKRRRSASIQYGRSDTAVDKTRVGKPVGYRFRQIN